MKAFCKQCRYCKNKRHPGGWYKFPVCLKHKIYEYDFFEICIDYKDCTHINKNNDCKDFELKTIYKIINFIKSLFKGEKEQ